MSQFPINSELQFGVKFSYYQNTTKKIINQQFYCLK